MRHAEFISKRALIEATDAELAETLGVPLATLESWQAGAAKVPRRQARWLEFYADIDERGRALRSSGLPECTWMEAWDAAPIEDDDDAFAATMKAAEDHAKTCGTCQARERFALDRFGPAPEYPLGAGFAAFAWLLKVPEVLQPAAFSAAFLAAVVLLRALFTIPAIIARPALLGPLLLAMLAAAGGGAMGGLAFSLTRPTLKRLGRPGDYLSGIVAVSAYLLSINLVSPVAFGEQLVSGRSGWFAFAITAVLFGMFVGHSWFGPGKTTKPK